MALQLLHKWQGNFLGGNMKKHSTLLGQLLGISVLLGAVLTSSPAQANNFGLSLGLNYNSGGNGYGHYPPPMFGYGAAGGSFGACAGAGGYLGGMGGGGFGGGFAAPSMPMMPSLPPLPPLIPPHMQAGMGGGFGGGLGMGGAPYCYCGGGGGMYQGPMQAYGPPPMMGPVAGGPYMGGGFGGGGGGGGGYAGGGGMVSGGGGGAGAYQISGGGTTIIDMRATNEWEKSDTADIVWGAAIGMGMQTTNVFPFTGPRNAYTNLDFFYNQGPRPYDFQPRPHAAP